MRIHRVHDNTQSNVLVDLGEFLFSIEECQFHRAVELWIELHMKFLTQYLPQEFPPLKRIGFSFDYPVVYNRIAIPIEPGEIFGSERKSWWHFEVCT